MTTSLFPLNSRAVRFAVLATVICCAIAHPAAAQTTFNANAGSLGAIPDSPGGPQVPGFPRDVTFNVTGLPGTVTHVSVSMTVSHPFVGDLRVTLFSPTGGEHTIFGYTGATSITNPGNLGYGTDLAGTYTFSDTAISDWWYAASQYVTVPVLPPGAYRTSLRGPLYPPGALTNMDVVFAGGAPNGTWTLRFTDGFGPFSGSVTAAALTVTSAVIPPPTTAQDSFQAQEFYGLVVPAPGVLANDTNTLGGGTMTAQLIQNAAHGSVSLNANGSFSYSPTYGYAGPDSFLYRAFNAGGAGNVATVYLTVVPLPPYAADDAYSTAYRTLLTTAAPGVLTNDSCSAAPCTAELVAAAANGAVALNGDGSFTYLPNVGFSGTDTFTYHARNSTGPGITATVSIDVAAPTDLQPATDLLAWNVNGNVVTLRWKAPTAGPAPTGYVMEGGIAPGQVLGSVPTGSASPIFTFTAPTGSFYLRVHSLGNGARSQASNEIRVHVNVPAAPSAPADLTGTVSGSTVALAWRTTYGGAAPTGITLDVSGAANGSAPLGATESFFASGVPNGTYTLAVRATNASGTSVASAPVTLTVPAPGGCSGAPLPPANFLAYRVSSTLSVVWDPPATGAAPASYLLKVTGALSGTVPVPGRSLGGVVGSGSYTLSVAAVNACGTSAFTAGQTVVIP